ncbi:hypothetical protein SDC9_71194 [bioreactor metagenome]|uniref:HTH cro/C1-type domain-containing protein n=1 Tax=bioreactor metagenome TaxID=1076179 RepID=A0A644Y8C8_9ZZZZ
MSRCYPHISEHLGCLMKTQNINGGDLSLKTEIRPQLIKDILRGDIFCLSLRNVRALSKHFGMSIFEFIDYISQ